MSMDTPMLIIGADHAGYKLKEYLKKELSSKYEIKDLGTTSEKSTDYPDYAKKVAAEVKKQKATGILVCHTGNGMAITANKVKGIRAAHVTSIKTAKLAKMHNHANVITLGQALTTRKEALKIVKTFIATKRDTDKRHVRRVKKIE